MSIKEQQEQRIDIQQSEGMDEAQRQLFLNVRRSKSDDSFLGKLILNKNQIQKRPLILNINDGDNNEVTQNNIHVFKKIKKEKKKNLCDYTKNICGYITKKIIREFAGPNYVCQVKKMCEQQICDYQQCKSFYQSKIEQITGPSHIPALLRAKDKNQRRLKRVFTRFFEWFLKQRYLRYLLLEGKMADKRLYIEYKNTVLLSMLQQNRTQNQQVKVQQQFQ